MFAPALSEESDPLCFSFLDERRSDVDPMSESLFSDLTVNDVRTSSSPR